MTSRRTLPSMERDIAERFAATAVEGITLAQARQIIGEFLALIVRCPACNGTGEITFGRGMTIWVRDPSRQEDEDRTIAPGTRGSCPLCVGEQGGYDAEHVAWRCVVGDTPAACQFDLTGDAKRREKHEKCGYRVSLPLAQ